MHSLAILVAAFSLLTFATAQTETQFDAESTSLVLPHCPTAVASINSELNACQSSLYESIQGPCTGTLENDDCHDAICSYATAAATCWSEFCPGYIDVWKSPLGGTRPCFGTVTSETASPTASSVFTTTGDDTSATTSVAVFTSGGTGVVVARSSSTQATTMTSVRTSSGVTVATSSSTGGVGRVKMEGGVFTGLIGAFAFFM